MNDKQWLNILSDFCDDLDANIRLGKPLDNVSIPEKYKDLDHYRKGIDAATNKEEIEIAFRKAKRAMKTLHDRKIIQFNSDTKHRPFYEKPLLHALTLAVEHGL